MAVMTATSTSKRAYLSNEGNGTVNDSVAIRLGPSATGTVYIQRTTKSKNTSAASASSFYISGTETYSVSLTAGDQLNVYAASDTEIRIDGNESGSFGPVA